MHTQVCSHRGTGSAHSPVECQCECDGGRAVMAWPNMLRSVGQKVHDPGTDGVVESKIHTFGDQLGGNNFTYADLKSTNSILT